MVRIIAGELKGRRIDVPARVEVRPTTDRIREALFSILQRQVPGARVLDAYAGTGALGFEALSRGARSATFVERDPVVVSALRVTAARLGVEARCSIVAGEAVGSVSSRRLGDPFDLVFADPPFAGDDGAAFVAAAAARGLLADDGLLVLEASGRRGAPETPGTGLAQVRTARYGEVALHFYRAGS
jgi:16S rRNA (guanine966-N2)-methyltransferase